MRSCHAATATATSDLLLTLPPQAKVRSLAFMEQRGELAAMCTDGSIQLWGEDCQEAHVWGSAGASEHALAPAWLREESTSGMGAAAPPVEAAVAAGGQGRGRGARRVGRLTSSMGPLRTVSWGGPGPGLWASLWGGPG